jgi:hypothetical protein
MGRGPAGKWTNQQGFLSFFEVGDAMAKEMRYYIT